ncbi:MAG: PfkB family carbohydrate kinase [Bacteroidota bacterium]
MTSNNKPIDILCVGETLIDFIGTQVEEPIKHTKDYHRYLGGSPTNVAMNMARLGMNVKMAASVGDDGFGDYVIKRFKETSIGIDGIREVAGTPTTVIFVNRTVSTPEFIPFRGADALILPEQLPLSVLQQTRIFHTSCFALSKDPAQSTILQKAAEAKAAGCQLSIDANYSEKIWPDANEAARVVASYCRLGPLVKLSQDDVDRLFGAGMSHEALFEKLHGLGAKLVCLTLGKEGAKLSEPGMPMIQLSAVKVEKIMDATGAGDAFWSGFLYSKLQGRSNQISLETALKMAAIKLQNVGRIPDYALAISNVLDT